MLHRTAGVDGDPNLARHQSMKAAENPRMELRWIPVKANHNHL